MRAVNIGFYLLNVFSEVEVNGKQWAICSSRENLYSLKFGNEQDEKQQQKQCLVGVWGNREKSISLGKRSSFTTQVTSISSSVLSNNFSKTCEYLRPSRFKVKHNKPFSERHNLCIAPWTVFLIMPFVRISNSQSSKLKRKERYGENL